MTATRLTFALGRPVILSEPAPCYSCRIDEKGRVQHNELRNVYSCSIEREATDEEVNAWRNER